MNIRDLMNRLTQIEARTLLDEGLRLSNVIAGIAGQETNDAERFKTIASLAKQNSLPGLYDPVSGQFVKVDGSTTNTADKETDKKLAYMGLIPDNAATSTYWGSVFGTSGKDYDTGLRDVSGKAIAAQDQDEREAELIAELKRLVPRYLELKNKTRAARRRRGGQSGQAGQAADPTTPIKVQKMSDGKTLKTYSDGKQIIYDPERSTDYVHSIQGSPGSFLVGTKEKPFQLPAGVTFIRENAISKALIEGFGYSLAEDDTTDMAIAGGVGGYAGKKLLGKALPGVAAGISAADTYQRMRDGDYVGAGLAGLSTALCLIPYVGFIPSLVPDAINFWRDYKKKKAASGSQAQEANRLKQLQYLIGAKPTGVYDADTKTKLIQWQQQAGIVPANGLPSEVVYKQANIQESAQRSLAEIKQDLLLFEDESENPPILFLKGGVMYALLPTGQLINEKGQQVDGETLSPITAEAAGPLAGAFAKAVEYMAKMKPKFLSKAADAEKIAADAKVASQAVSTVAKEAGEEVVVEGVRYVWTRGGWAEVSTKNGHPHLVFAPKELAPKLDKALADMKAGAAAEKTAAKAAADAEKAAAADAEKAASSEKNKARLDKAKEVGKKALGPAIVAGGGLYAAHELSGEEDPFHNADGTVPGVTDQNAPGGDTGQGRQAGQSIDGGEDDYSKLSPEERAKREQEDDDLDDFNELRDRMNAIIAELLKSKNPEIRKQLTTVRDQLAGVEPIASGQKAEPAPSK